MRQTANDGRIGHLAITYALLVPLILLSVAGGFSFQSQGYNTEIGNYATDMLAKSDADTAEARLVTGVLLLSTFALIVFNRKALAKVIGDCRVLLLPPVWAVVSAIWSNDPLADTATRGFPYDQHFIRSYPGWEIQYKPTDPSIGCSRSV